MDLKDMTEDDQAKVKKIVAKVTDLVDKTGWARVGNSRSAFYSPSVWHAAIAELGGVGIVVTDGAVGRSIRFARS